MRGSRRLVVACPLIVGLVASFTGSAPASAATAPTAPRVDLSTRAGVDALLVSLGVDPARAQFQRGMRNYVGPHCPSANWTCATTNRPVVQIVDVAGGTNRFVATAESGSARLVVVQVAQTASASNSATCTAASCEIVQENDSGNNKATIRQSVSQTDHSPPVQLDTQHAGVSQVNGSGQNLADITQYINQDTHVVAPEVVQDQQAYQDISNGPSLGCPQTVGLCQTNGSGDNLATVDQSQFQSAHADGNSITQCQNTADDLSVPACQHQSPPCPSGITLSCPNQLFTGEQDSTSGRNDLKIDQDIDQGQFANAPTTNTNCTSPPSPGICQQESNPQGGEEIDHSQSSSALSSLMTDQTEHQSQNAPTGICAVCQWVYGPMAKPSFQQDNPGDLTDIDQFSMIATGDNAQIFDDLIADCQTTGTCHIDQETNINNTKFENPLHCDAMGCFVETVCFPDSESPGGAFCEQGGD
jgi:hypothetical protein